MKRRQFIQHTATASVASAFLPAALAPNDLHVSCNLYTWYSYYLREGKNFYADTDAGLEQVAVSGMDGIEPSLSSVAQVEEIGPMLSKHGLEMRSVYVNSKLHIKEEAEASIDSVLEIVERCKPYGTRVVVTNPSPIGWASKENKTDQQLMDQAVALDTLGARLRAMGLTLAYHTHDSEFRAGAREFHHMMLTTDPLNVAFCLDVHWVYRGALNSNIALFDVIKMYGERIAELHIRQSKDYVWTETFGEGDIDYHRVVQVLNEMNLNPLIVLEQAVEENTPNTMTPLEAHHESQQAIRQVFAPFG